MKYLLLTIAFLGLLCSAKAQSDTSIAQFGTTHYGFPGENLPNVDTEKVYFLVGWSQVPRKTGFKTFKWDSAKQSYYLRDDYDSAFDPRIYQILGYIALRKVTDQWNETYWMETAAYLDDKKKLLSPDLIIWQFKSRK